MGFINEVLAKPWSNSVFKSKNSSDPISARACGKAASTKIRPTLTFVVACNDPPNWEQTPKGEDNIKHNSFNSKVDFISIPIESNNLSLTEEPHPKVLDTIKSRLEFKGNIRLSNSGNSYNIFNDKLDVEDDMVELTITTA